jgi:hypothetical protein
MKTKLLFTVFYSIIVLTMSAQDTLKINFKPAGTPGADGWDSILVADKTAYAAGVLNVNVFNSTVSVNPLWLNSPDAVNVRAIDRSGTEFQYTGPLANVLRSYIAVDSRYSNDCDIVGVQISGLPEGTYTFESYHHDFIDQYGSFTSSTSVNGNNLDFDFLGKMISHSINAEQFNLRYPTEPLDPAVAIEFQNHYVKNSLDSVTKYKFDQIEISGAGDIILVSFKNMLPPDPNMSHSLKFVLINGFKLYKSSSSGLEDITLNSLSVYPNPASGILNIDLNSSSGENINISIYDITGKELYKNNIEPITDQHLHLDISALQSGIYMIKIYDNKTSRIGKIEVK